MTAKQLLKRIHEAEMLAVGEFAKVKVDQWGPMTKAMAADGMVNGITVALAHFARRLVAVKDDRVAALRMHADAEEVWTMTAFYAECSDIQDSKPVRQALALVQHYSREFRRIGS